MTLGRPPERIRYAPAAGRWPTAAEAGRSVLFSPVALGPLRLAQRTWVPAMVPWRGDLAQAYLQLGMRREARALVVEQLGRPGAMVGPRARAIALRTLAGCAEPPERVRILRDYGMFDRREAPQYYPVAARSLES